MALHSLGMSWLFSLRMLAIPLQLHNQFTYVELRGLVNNKAKNDIQIYLAIQDITEYKHTQETISCLNEKLEKKIVAQTSALIEKQSGFNRKN